jgi:general secretion pathway protein K
MKKAKEKGMATVLVLMVMAIITAMVVEFAYASYTSTIALSNWTDIQRLSGVARSAVYVAVKELAEKHAGVSYTYPDKIEMVLEKILANFEGKVLISVEDENAKFNLNSLVSPNGTMNTLAYGSLQRLLKNLDLDERIAERIADWIDRNEEPRLADSEVGAKNDYMDSVEELSLIRGVDNKTFAKLLPFITVYGMNGVTTNLVNINTAPLFVIMALDENITRDLAERIINYRSLQPFQQVSDIVKVAGFEGSLGQSLMGRIAVKTSHFRMISIAEDNGIRRAIECVIESEGSGFTIRYWQEV